MFTFKLPKLCNFSNSRKLPKEFQSPQLSQSDMHALLFQTFWDQCDSSYVKFYPGAINLANDLAGKYFALGGIQKALIDKPMVGRFDQVRFICLRDNNQLVLLMDVTCLDAGLSPVMIYCEEYAGFVAEPTSFVEYNTLHHLDFGPRQ